MKRTMLVLSVAMLGAPLPAVAADVTVDMNAISAEGVGDRVGTVQLSDSPDGLVITPALKTPLKGGEHGFHFHQNPSCDPGERGGETKAGIAAGGHYDPAASPLGHEGPEGEGHIGDLPVLVVGDDGGATQAVTAKRLKVADVAGRSLMIHAEGDNYEDEPKLDGGGGDRVICGVIPK